MKKPLRLEFVFVAGKDGAGYVRYENGSGTIPVKRTTEKELRKGAAGRPSEFESRWVEVPSDGKGGTYVIVSQGAVVNSLRYIRRDGKAFTFQEDDDAAGSSGCEWR